MLSPLRRYRARKMRWAVRWWAALPPGWQRYIRRERPLGETRSMLHLVSKHRAHLIAMYGPEADLDRVR